MNNKKIFRWRLTRISFQDEQTLGSLHVFLFNDFQFSLATLEQEMSNNDANDSCIMPGSYVVVPHRSEKFGKCFRVMDVAHRSGILFHTLNYYRQSKGCIGTGLMHRSVDSDDYIDIASSGAAHKKLVDLCWDESSKILLEIS